MKNTGSFQRRLMRGIGTAAVLMLATGCFADGLLVKDGEKVAFLGDSITAGGWSDGGYIRLVVEGLKAQGVNITPIPAGVGGHKSNDMLARLDRDVLDKDPDWMTLSCGVNDVWHGANGVVLEDYKKNITQIVEKALAKKVKVILFTSTPIGEEDNDNNKKLAAYNDFLRELAKKYKLPLADQSEAFLKFLRQRETDRSSRYLTVDGVHMNPEGNVMMAKVCLQAMGLSPAQIQEAETVWEDQPKTATITARPYDPRQDFTVSLRVYRQIAEAAQVQHVQAVDLICSEWLKAWGQAVANHAGESIIDAEAVKRETVGLWQERLSALQKK